MELSEANNILLTGPPRAGKTTVIIKVAETLGERADGFFTKELREMGKRTGFLIVSLSGEEGLLAHVDLKGGPRVSKYTVNLDDLESIGVGSVHRAIESGKIIVVDEIGKMELFSEGFRREILRALDSPARMIATVREGSEPFCDSIKRREDVSVIRLYDSNRDQMPGIILEALGERPVL